MKTRYISIDSICCLLMEINGLLNAAYNIVRGAYSNEEFKEITCVINRLKESKMKEIIQEIDPGAFVTVYDVAEVRGGNFRKVNIH